MSSTATPIETVSTTEVTKRYSAAKDVIEWAKQNEDPIQLIAWLVEGQRFIESIDFLSYWLTPQKLVWWGSLCVWETERDMLSPSVDAAMQRIINWLRDPSESRRTKLNDIDSLMKPDHPIRFLGNAAKFSSGSMVSADLPPVSPPPFLYCKLGSAAVKLAGAKSDPANFISVHRQIVKLGMDVAQGKNCWQ